MSLHLGHFDDILRGSAQPLCQPLSSPDLTVWPKQTGLNAVIGKRKLINGFSNSGFWIGSIDNGSHKVAVIEVVDRFIQQNKFLSGHSAPPLVFQFLAVQTRRIVNNCNILGGVVRNLLRSAFGVRKIHIQRSGVF